MSEPSAEEIITTLGLEPHPEGGHFRETFRDRTLAGRSISTAILYLLKEGEVSHWHRVDAAEVWHWHAGAPLALSQAEAGQAARAQVLGNDVIAGERPQIVVPARVWQSARSLGAWTLVGCTVAPGFDFAGFELAPPGWAPGETGADNLAR
ncbi:MAG: cupin domain-containing protein [Caulobacterales bacterium]|nr:cupin domain-containing protein [Caulobacterales bacterium]